jgi:glutamyl-tRNA synthetase
LQVTGYALQVKELLENKGIAITDQAQFIQVLELVKERCVLLTDFAEQAGFFFKAPEKYDMAAVQPKWNEAKQVFFAELIRNFELSNNWNAHDLETGFKEMAAAHQIKPGELLLPLRIMLVGGKFGPHVFDIVEILGKEETVARIRRFLALLQ